MMIPDFLIMVGALEILASNLYDSLAGLATEPELAKRLRSLASDEISQAEALKTRSKYYQEMPALFAGVKMQDEELWSGIEQGKKLQGQLNQGLGLLDGLKEMLELDKRRERVHWTASMTIVEPSLRQLFVNMDKTDQSHIDSLKDMIVAFGSNARLG
jgi:rubrerythrin